MLSRLVGALHGAAIPILPDLGADIAKLADNEEHGRKRMLALQAALIEMLTQMDPDYTFFPKERRSLASTSQRCPDAANPDHHSSA